MLFRSELLGEQGAARAREKTMRPRRACCMAREKPGTQTLRGRTTGQTDHWVWLLGLTGGLGSWASIIVGPKENCPMGLMD